MSHFVLVADFACTWCDAQPGECCRTRMGRTMGIEYHKRRRELFRVAVSLLTAERIEEVDLALQHGQSIELYERAAETFAALMEDRAREKTSAEAGWAIANERLKEIRKLRDLVGAQLSDDEARDVIALDVSACKGFVNIDTASMREGGHVVMRVKR